MQLLTWAMYQLARKLHWFKQGNKDLKNKRGCDLKNCNTFLWYTAGKFCPCSTENWEAKVNVVLTKEMYDGVEVSMKEEENFCLQNHIQRDFMTYGSRSHSPTHIRLYRRTSNKPVLRTNWVSKYGLCVKMYLQYYLHLEIRKK